MRSMLVLIALIAIAVPGCDRKPDTDTATQARARADWPGFTQRFIEEHFKAQPFFAVKAGRHEFDGRMPDWSAEGFRKEIERLRKAREEVDAFDAAELPPAQALERNHLLAVLDEELFWLDTAKEPFRNPAWYIGELDPDIYLSTTYAPVEKRMAGYIGYAKAIPAITQAVRANLKTPLPKTFVERAVAGFGGYAEFYRNDVAKVFAEVRDPQLQKELAAANGAAADSMAELARWFESQRKDATDDFALGADLFAQMLRQTERVEVPLERLEEIGRADTERNFKALQAACKAYLRGGALPACVEKMQRNKPKEGAVRGARAQLQELRQFVEDYGIVTVPGGEEARVAEAPPYNRANFAYINVPGPFDKGQPSTYYVAPPDPKWTPAEQAAYTPGEARLLATSVHEVWPGHFLQFLHANRASSLVSSLWVGYAYAEGWAHYTEEMMLDRGLRNGDPEARIGQLLAALLRNVRYQCAIGLHTRGMTLEECERLFRERALADPGNSRQQAARGTYDPAYLNYTLGKLMIMKLRDDWLARHPNDGTDEEARLRVFHDKFLSYGGPPIPLVRAAMVGEGPPL
jgi:uncharacterized protein (DUF885 family)